MIIAHSEKYGVLVLDGEDNETLEYSVIQGELEYTWSDEGEFKRSLYCAEVCTYDTLADALCEFNRVIMLSADSEETLQ